MLDSYSLKFGYGRGLPGGITCAWGARLIYPADLVHDRQDTIKDDIDKPKVLHEWLNSGPLKAALEKAALREVPAHGSTEIVLYEDERGKILANPQASHGYLYVCAYLFEHVEALA